MSYVKRKRGQTHQQYIRALQAQVELLDRKLTQKNHQLTEVINQIGIVPTELYNEVVEERNRLISRLKSYHLWTGYI